MRKKHQADFVLIQKVQALAELLRTGHQTAWASHLNRTIQSCHSDSHLARDILRFYEGLGSLKEILLFVDGHAESKINKDFSDLRDDVYALCQQYNVSLGDPAT